jgi:hypothetical protein
MSDVRFCAQRDGGAHLCGTARWCGSNYDKFGNEKFADHTVQVDAEMEPSLHYGYTTFDSIFRGLLTVFQCATKQGWSEEMYQMMDGFNTVFGAIFVVFLILFTSDIVVNVFLSAIWAALSEAKRDYEFAKMTLRKARSRYKTNLASPLSLAPESPEVTPNSRHRVTAVAEAVWRNPVVACLFEATILANACVVAAMYSMESHDTSVKLRTAHIAFVGVFCVEQLLRICRSTDLAAYFLYETCIS